MANGCSAMSALDRLGVINVKWFWCVHFTGPAPYSKAASLRSLCSCHRCHFKSLPQSSCKLSVNSLFDAVALLWFCGDDYMRRIYVSFAMAIKLFNNSFNSVAVNRPLRYFLGDRNAYLAVCLSAQHVECKQSATTKLSVGIDRFEMRLGPTAVLI